MLSIIVVTIIVTRRLCVVYLRKNCSISFFELLKYNEKVWKNKNQATNNTKLCTTSNIQIKCTTVCRNSENVTENNYIICVST